MAQPFFSVIVPVYKAEAYLHQCIDSVLGQSFEDFEVILVDDGSPDSSGAICDEYAAKDQRVTVIHKENGGNVSARRAGYAASSGKYIVHLDSDDYLDTQLLALAEEKIREHGVDAVLFGFIHFDEQEHTNHMQCLPAGLYRDSDMNEIRENLIQGKTSGPAIFNSLWSVIIRREIFLPFLELVPTKLYRGEDLAATAPALSNCRSAYIMDRYGYYYRKAPGSIMNTVKGDEVEQAMLVAEYLLEKMGSSYREKLDNYVLLHLYAYLKQMVIGKSRKDYIKAVRAILDDRLCRHLKGARCNTNEHISNKVVFFLLGNKWFGLFRLMVKMRN